MSAMKEINQGPRRGRRGGGADLVEKRSKCIWAEGRAGARTLSSLGTRGAHQLVSRLRDQGEPACGWQALKTAQDARHSSPLVMSMREDHACKTVGLTPTCGRHLINVSSLSPSGSGSLGPERGSVPGTALLAIFSHEALMAPRGPSSKPACHHPRAHFLPLSNYF